MKNKFILISVSLSLLLVLFVGVFWVNVSKPNTLLNGEKVSFKTTEQLLSIIDEQASNYMYQMKVDDEIIEYSPEDFGITVNREATVKSIMLGPGNHSLKLSIDGNVLDRKLKEMEEKYDKKMSEPEIVFDKKYMVSKGQNGQEVVVEELKELLEVNFAENNRGEIIEVPIKVVHPTVKEAVLKNNAEQANILLDRNITLIGKSENLSISKKTIKNWIQFDNGVSLNKKKVKKWLEDNSEGTEIKLQDGLRRVNSDGKAVRVIYEKVDGYKTNIDKTVNALLKQFDKGDGSVEIIYDKVEAKWTEEQIDKGAEKLLYPALPGEKWININLSSHEITAYEGATPVLSSPMISAANAYPNAIGEYTVYAKVPTQTMEGDNADGTRYKTENVPWILYYHGGYALHGAYWRDSFGYNAGDAGSHGCINLPVGTAKTLYDWADEGTKVLSYY